MKIVKLMTTVLLLTSLTRLAYCSGVAVPNCAILAQNPASTNLSLLSGDADSTSPTGIEIELEGRFIRGVQVTYPKGVSLNELKASLSKHLDVEPKQMAADLFLWRHEEKAVSAMLSMEKKRWTVIIRHTGRLPK